MMICEKIGAELVSIHSEEVPVSRFVVCLMRSRSGLESDAMARTRFTRKRYTVLPVIVEAVDNRYRDETERRAITALLSLLGASDLAI